MFIGLTIGNHGEVRDDCSFYTELYIAHGKGYILSLEQTTIYYNQKTNFTITIENQGKVSAKFWLFGYPPDTNWNLIGATESYTLESN